MAKNRFTQASVINNPHNTISGCVRIINTEALKGVVVISRDVAERMELSANDRITVVTSGEDIGIRKTDKTDEMDTFHIGRYGKTKSVCIRSRNLCNYIFEKFGITETEGIFVFKAGIEGKTIVFSKAALIG